MCILCTIIKVLVVIHALTEYFKQHHRWEWRISSWCWESEDTEELNPEYASSSFPFFDMFDIHDNVVMYDGLTVVSPSLLKRHRSGLSPNLCKNEKEDCFTFASWHMNSKQQQVHDPLTWLLLYKNIHTGSCSTYPQLLFLSFGNIWSTGPGEGPQHTGMRCKSEGRETWFQWPPGKRSLLGQQSTTGCFDILSPWRWSCCI